MALQKPVLIVPPNDAEAVMIQQLAQKLELPTILSKQLHGASLDKGHNYVVQVKEGGYETAIVIEMPGLESEQALKEMGVEVVLIDHHHYTGLDRAHGPDGNMLPSSLEQFLELFDVTDAQLKGWELDPRLVRGIGIQDRGYIWALLEEGYTKEEAMEVMAYADELTAHLHNPKTEERKWELSRKAWKNRTEWNGFYIVKTRADLQLRPRLSRIVAEEMGKPTALIIVEHGRGIIYVQESDYAMGLFQTFGGFTFGVDRNWGHKNEVGMKEVTLHDVKRVILELQA
ncbi:MAG: hypothetical protein P8J32_00715 [bacterium]|jgi:hypothetical protein|nr:hypothetical protein [bacterium]